MSEPKVKLHPEFKVGETIIHTESGSEHKVLKIEVRGEKTYLKAEGLAGLVDATVFHKKA